jgi:hypothetical protein
VAGYKIGDLVRVRSRAWYEQNKNWSGEVRDPGVGDSFVSMMAKFCGGVMKISRVYGMAGQANWYNLEGDDRFGWCEWMFEPPENLIENVRDAAL